MNVHVAMNEAAVCRNCGAGLFGRYCSHCGQPADVHVPSTRELLHEVLEGLTHSDSRIWSTLKCLLFKPGKLTQEFVAGRRAAYLPPFRLYLIVSVTFFLIASFSHLKGEVVQVGHGVHRAQESDCTNGTIDIPWLSNKPGWHQRFERACVGMVRDNGADWLRTGVEIMPKAMFVFLPLIAFLHMLMYWRPRHRYVLHLLFFLHLHAFFFFVATLLLLSDHAATLWPALTPLDGFVSTCLFWVLIVYSIVAMKLVFQMSWRLTVAKALVLFFIYVTMLGLTVAGVFFYAALQL